MALDNQVFVNGHGNTRPELQNLPPKYSSFLCLLTILSFLAKLQCEIRSDNYRVTDFIYSVVALMDSREGHRMH